MILGLAACQQSESPAPQAPSSETTAPTTQSEAPANDVRDVKQAGTSPVASMEKQVDNTTMKEVIKEAEKSEAQPVAEAPAKAVAESPKPAPVTEAAKSSQPAPTATVPATPVTTAVTKAPAAKAPDMTPVFNTSKCKSCHAIDKDKLGPAWATVAKDYGTADALAAVFKSGFAVGDRKVITNDSKWKGKAGIMTSQYNSMIKGHEDAVAKALFDAVASGTM